MEASYKGDRITSVASEKPDSDRWVVTVDVLSPEPHGAHNARFEGPLEGFASKKEAESWGIKFGKKWIDDGKPALGEGIKS